ncbi:MAG: TonB-dependent receptor [Acidobacteriia bacterium]|nr:TonB-dependent receptor [Terriglobia bacterium]
MQLRRVAAWFLFALSAFAQSDRGTITGTVTDPAGAVVPGAPVEARNVQTGAVYQAAGSSTGNYTLSQLPTGTYEVSVTVAGFKKFVRQNIVLPVAQTVRIDVALEVGSATESVTVTEAAPLLKTESGELSHNVRTEQLDNLPVLGIGAGASQAGIRNPYAVMQLLPGSDWRPDSSVRLNGLPSNTQSLRIEGQDSTNGLIGTQSMTQPSVDAIQELAIQTSNFAAEFGQAGGGVFNATMRSGTNAYHGSAYEYFVNEALNAGQPFTSDGSGHLRRPRQRRNDYGFTFGGPIEIPKVYDGHDKTFFFFSFEQFRETVINNTTTITVPTAAYRTGDFSKALTNRNVCPAATPNCDPLGRPIMENAVYNPLSTQVVGGQRVRDPFVGNVIPKAQLDPVSLRVVSLIPQPTNGGLTNNYLAPFTNPRLTYIPSLKLDHSLSAKTKISGYWSLTSTNTPNNNTLPAPITSAVGSDIKAQTVRLNFDQTVTPTLLLHLGAGLIYNGVNQPVAPYDPVAGIGLTGTYANLFPSIQGLNQAQGGMSANMGPGAKVNLVNTKPTANASLTWVRNNHTYKAGGEMILEGYPAANETYANGWIVFNAIESGLPSTLGQSLTGGVPGFPFASFMLGAVDNGFIGVPSKSRMGAKAFSWFVQDSWKVTRKLTVDYGLRYDFQTFLREQHGRIPYFSVSTPNPTAGGKLGGVAFDGYGPGHCNCDIAHNYPFAFGPRIGVAYQFMSKTVLRVGVGVSYFKTAQNGFNSYSTGSQNIYNAPSYGDPAYSLSAGVPYKITWPNFDPGQVPLPGTVASPSQQIDPHAGRPPRILEWSIGLQREIGKDIVVEATYVGNRGVWWNSAYIICPNCLTPEALAAYKLDLNNAADRTLLASPLNSSIAINRGFANPPYSGFPLTSPVNQALRPFPQFGNITNMHWAPNGDTWYDSLQLKAVKRFSHGLDVTASYTWEKSFSMGTEADISTLSPVSPATNDVFNRAQNRYLSGLDQPMLLVIAGSYTTPKWGTGQSMAGRALSWAARDWQIGTILRYASGLPIMAPIATNGIRELLFRQTGAVGTTGGTFWNRVPDQPLFLQDLNCHCFDPNTNFVLNPKAWVNPAAGQWGTSAGFYGDYRYQRRPSESLSLGRNFSFREGRMNFQVRADFTNVFNRTEPVNPVSNNAGATQSTSGGLTTGGFGYINTASVFAQPRQGTLVARFTF